MEKKPTKKKNFFLFLSLFTLFSLSLVSIFIFFGSFEHPKSHLEHQKIKDKLKSTQEVVKIPPTSHSKITSPFPLLPKAHSRKIYPQSSISYNGRKLIGPGIISISKSGIENLQIKNNKNPFWKRVLNQNLYRFHQKGTVIKIEHRDSLINVTGTSGRYMESVIVETTLTNGQKFAYEALVDSSNGKIMQTWNKTRFDFPSRTAELFAPTGTL